MGSPSRRLVIAAAFALVGLSLAATAAESVHLYRTTAGGCSMAEGALTDDPPESTGPVGATVFVMHNTFTDQATLLPYTEITAGESVTWKWASLHCHSVTNGLVGTGTGRFESGFHYPREESFPPLSGQLFYFPVPSLDPQLSFTHTFEQPGTYTYFCIHHWTVGMQGVVVVEAA